MVIVTKASEQRIINQGKFIIRLFPLGKSIPGHNDSGIYQLGRVDHATLEGGVLVKMHMHHNDEILSYMRKGTMVHKDSNGNEVPIHNQYLMMMNAGSGFYHEEGVPDGGETVEMLQIFMRPRADELSPKVQFYKLEEVYSINKWRLIGGNEQSAAPLKINSDVQVFDMRVENATIPIPPLAGKTGYLYVFDGKVSIPEKHLALSKGDAVLIEGEALSVEAAAASDLVYFILDKQSTVSRNGLYAH